MENEKPAPPQGRRVVIRVARQAGLVALFLVVAILGTLSGVLFAYADDLPEISALDSYQPNTITHLLARDGREIGEYAIERRVVIGYDQIAPVLRQAIMASEDADFDSRLLRRCGGDIDETHDRHQRRHMFPHDSAFLVSGGRRLYDRTPAITRALGARQSAKVRAAR